MKLDLEIGRISDTVSAINFYFNYKTWNNMFIKEDFKGSELYFEFYDEIKEKITFIPDYLYPIFYFDGEKPSPISTSLYLKLIKKIYLLKI